MRAVIACIALAFLVFGAGCDKGEHKAPESSAATTTAAAAAGFVAVPAEGKKFDPPIKPEQVPPGAWYCDMGNVHWAQMNEGNKTCPVCNMELKQKPAK